MRETTRIEDGAYSLMGIFQVNMPIIYGEGLASFRRLQEEILKLCNDHTLFSWQNAMMFLLPSQQVRHAGDNVESLASSPADFTRFDGEMRNIPLEDYPKAFEAFARTRALGIGAGLFSSRKIKKVRPDDMIRDRETLTTFTHQWTSLPLAIPTFTMTGQGMRCHLSIIESPKQSRTAIAVLACQWAPTSDGEDQPPAYAGLVLERLSDNAKLPLYAVSMGHNSQYGVNMNRMFIADGRLQGHSAHRDSPPRSNDENAAEASSRIFKHPPTLRWMDLYIDTTPIRTSPAAPSPVPRDHIIAPWAFRSLLQVGFTLTSSDDDYIRRTPFVSTLFELEDEAASRSASHPRLRRRWDQKFRWIPPSAPDETSTHTAAEAFKAQAQRSWSDTYTVSVTISVGDRELSSSSIELDKDEYLRLATRSLSRDFGDAERTVRLTLLRSTPEGAFGSWTDDSFALDVEPSGTIYRELASRYHQQVVDNVPAPQRRDAV